MTSTQKTMLVLGLAWLVFGRKAAKPLTLAQIRALASSAGFPDPTVAAAVAMAESGGRVDAVGDLSLGQSRGLWQIHLPSHPEWAIQNLFDPSVNARAALAVSRGGLDWSPWTTFRTGAYKAFLGAA